MASFLMTQAQAGLAAFTMAAHLAPLDSEWSNDAAVLVRRMLPQLSDADLRRLARYARISPHEHWQAVAAEAEALGRGSL